MTDDEEDTVGGPEDEPDREPSYRRASPVVELATRMHAAEQQITDMVGVKGGKGGGRVDTLERTIKSWRAIAVAAVLSGIGSIAGVITIAMAYADERATNREWRRRAEADQAEVIRKLDDHLREGDRRGFRRDPDRDTTTPTAPAPSPKPGASP